MNRSLGRNWLRVQIERCYVIAIANFCFLVNVHFLCIFLFSPPSWHQTTPQCLKITEKVSFNIASEASYVYILSGQNFIKTAQNWQFGESKVGRKCQNVFKSLRNKSKDYFQTLWPKDPIDERDKTWLRRLERPLQMTLLWYNSYYGGSLELISGDMVS